MENKCLPCQRWCTLRHLPCLYNCCEMYFCWNRAFTLVARAAISDGVVSVTRACSSALPIKLCWSCIKIFFSGPWLCWFIISGKCMRCLENDWAEWLIWTNNERDGWKNMIKINTSAKPSSEFHWKWKGKKMALSRRTASNVKLKEKTGQRESHSSSCASSCSCKSFMFRWNGTASGFIKIYERNHHWKYKTLAGARGEVGEGGEQMEREGNSSGWRWWGEKQMRRRKTNREKLVK